MKLEGRRTKTVAKLHQQYRWMSGAGVVKRVNCLIVQFSPNLRTLGLPSIRTIFNYFFIFPLSEKWKLSSLLHQKVRKSLNFLFLLPLSALLPFPSAPCTGQFPKEISSFTSILTEFTRKWKEDSNVSPPVQKTYRTEEGKKVGGKFCRLSETRWDGYEITRRLIRFLCVAHSQSPPTLPLPRATARAKNRFNYPSEKIEISNEVAIIENYYGTRPSGAAAGFRDETGHNKNE